MASEIVDVDSNVDINLWGQSQEELEKQALEELQIFTEENNKKKNIKTSIVKTFDITSYLKNQEDLRKKNQEDRKSQNEVKKLKSINDNKVVKKKKKLSKRKNTDEHSDDNDDYLPAKKFKLRKSNVNVENANVLLEEKEAEDDKITTTEKKKKKSKQKGEDSDADYIPSDEDSGVEYSDEDGRIKSSSSNTNTTIANKKIKAAVISKYEDDGCMEKYLQRLNALHESEREEDDLLITSKTIKTPGRVVIPPKIADKLYSYQVDAVEWLYKLYRNEKGALLGDEMGLGKTVQIIAFLATLENCNLKSKYEMYKGLGPVLIVVPTTLISQWVQHFHLWTPKFRVAVLHSSGSFKGNKEELIHEINVNSNVLITTYSTVSKHFQELKAFNWHFLILDEGHKIRNPAAQVTKMVKRINALYRIILTGSPMQNNLKELWSLFDFVNPGMLGTLQAFLDHFADPITKGGYVNSTPLQEALALAMAKALQSKITSCMLRRTKDGVQNHIKLPIKSEQVLFCSITEEQRNLYKEFLMTEDVQICLGRGKSRLSQNQMRAHVFVAIQHMRKICNHPDLYLEGLEDEEDDGNDSINDQEIKAKGDYKRSGKMQVVDALLKIWKEQGHRVLLFTQSRVMLSLFKNYLEEQKYTYLKMDGSTNVNLRQSLIDSFNTNDSIFVFLLTTKVGGLGLNLIGANRVIIYDPDWNPATDIQARERAWRIGQLKDVTIFRLLSAGTIEEKIYRRQVYKQLLAKKVLVDPTVQKLFKTSDLYDIFSMQEEVDTNGMEKSQTNIFRKQRLEVQKKLDEKQINKKKTKKPTKQSLKKNDEDVESTNTSFDETLQKLNEEIPQKVKKGKNESISCDIKIKEKELQSQSNLSHVIDDISIFDDDDDNKSQEKTVNNDDNVELSEEKVRKMRELAQKIAHSISLDNEKKTRKKNKKEEKKRSKNKEQNSNIDGCKVEGLVKVETNKPNKQLTEKIESQDDYIMEKLFSTSGVQMSVSYENAFKTISKKQKSVSVEYEANLKADLAVQALEKSVFHQKL